MADNPADFSVTFQPSGRRGSAAAGTRVVRLHTDRGEVMGPMSGTVFTVTK